jgi:aspartyl protease family protein
MMAPSSSRTPLIKSGESSFRVACGRPQSWPRAACADALLCACLLLFCAGAGAQSVALSGVMGERALLVIDGAAQVLAAGESRGGVTLVSTDGDTALVERDGHRQTLRVGESPVSVGSHAAGSGARVTLHAGTGGHFMGTGQFNGVTLPFVVDTGASNVVMSTAQAEQIGLDYRNGQRGAVTTANGTVPAWLVHLDSVRLGAVEIYNVAVTVVPAGAPVVLLGNSFLGRFQMRQENDELVLEKRF